MKDDSSKVLFDGCNREEICAALTNIEGEKHGFTDKDWAWVSIMEAFRAKTTEELIDIYKREYGFE